MKKGLSKRFSFLTFQTADYLLKEDCYDFMGSDIHHAQHLASFDKKIKISNPKILEQVMAKNQFFK